MADTNLDISEVPPLQRRAVAGPDRLQVDDVSETHERQRYPLTFIQMRTEILHLRDQLRHAHQRRKDAEQKCQQAIDTYAATCAETFEACVQEQANLWREHFRDQYETAAGQLAAHRQHLVRVLSSSIPHSTDWMILARSARVLPL